MRQKKSNLIYYVIGIVVLAGVLFVASQEVPVKVEQVEQPRVGHRVQDGGAVFA